MPHQNRIVHTNSKLLRKYLSDLHKECFGTRARCFEASALKVYGVSAILLFVNSTTPITNTLEILDDQYL